MFAFISPYLLHVLFSRKLQAGSQNAIGFILVDVKDFPLPDMLTSCHNTENCWTNDCGTVIDGSCSVAGVTVNFHGLTTYGLARCTQQLQHCDLNRPKARHSNEINNTKQVKCELQRRWPPAAKALTLARWAATSHKCRSTLHTS